MSVKRLLSACLLCFLLFLDLGLARNCHSMRYYMEAIDTPDGGVEIRQVKRPTAALYGYFVLLVLAHCAAIRGLRKSPRA